MEGEHHRRLSLGSGCRSALLRQHAPVLGACRELGQAGRAGQGLHASSHLSQHAHLLCQIMALSAACLGCSSAADRYQLQCRSCIASSTCTPSRGPAERWRDLSCRASCIVNPNNVLPRGLSEHLQRGGRICHTGHLDNDSLGAVLVGDELCLGLRRLLLLWLLLQS